MQQKAMTAARKWISTGKLATTIELEDEATGIKYRMGLSGGTMYFEEMKKEDTVPDAGGDTEGGETGGSSEESGETENTGQEENE